MDGQLLYKHSFAVRKPKNVKMYVYYNSTYKKYIPKEIRSTYYLPSSFY